MMQYVLIHEVHTTKNVPFTSRKLIRLRQEGCADLTKPITHHTRSLNWSLAFETEVNLSMNALLLNTRVKKSKEDIAKFIFSYQVIHKSTLKCVVATSLMALLAISTITVLPRINFAISIM